MTKNDFTWTPHNESMLWGQYQDAIPIRTIARNMGITVGKVAGRLRNLKARNYQVTSRYQNFTGKPVTIMKLEPIACRFPIGDTTDSDMQYCGKRVDQNSPYCTEHHKHCYQPRLRKQR